MNYDSRTCRNHNGQITDKDHAYNWIHGQTERDDLRQDLLYRIHHCMTVNTHCPNNLKHKPWAFVI